MADSSASGADRPVPESPVIVALDFPSADRALALTERLDPRACRVKVGKELFTSAGPRFIADLQERGFDVFLDLKFHDIPNTTAAAVSAAADLGVWMVNVHAAGGRRMLEAAADALAQRREAPLLIGVTLLTSFDEKDFCELGFERSLEDQVVHLATLSAECGLDGVVCSAREAASLRARLGGDCLLVTPGIRPAGSAIDDQRRILTPREALSQGASYLVIGRPITAAEDPAEALRAINASLA